MHYLMRRLEESNGFVAKRVQLKSMFFVRDIYGEAFYMPPPYGKHGMVLLPYKFYKNKDRQPPDKIVRSPFAGLVSSIYKVQGGRCFKCATPMRIDRAVKRPNRFDLICPDCFNDPGPGMVWYTESAPIPGDVWDKIKPKLDLKKYERG